MRDKHPSKEKPIQETETLRKKISDLERLLQDQAEKEKHLAFLASFPESNPNPVLEVEASGALLYLNPAAKNLFPDLESRGLEHPWFQDWDSLRVLTEGDRGDSRMREIPVGSDWFEQRIYLDRERRSFRFYGFNITERKRAEKALQVSEMRLQAVVDNLPVGVWFADEAGKILYGNAAGQEIWQGAQYVLPEEFHEYKAWWADTGFPLGPDDWAVARAVRKGETSLNEILDIECFDGTRKTINNSAVPLCVGDGRLFGVVVLNEDITERENLLKEVRRTRDELEQKVQERTRDLAKANRELAEQSGILEGFFSSTITPIVFLDPKFNFIRVNEAYAKCCNRDIPSFSGRNHFELYPHPINEAIFRMVAETKIPYQASAQALSFSGHPEWGTTYWDWTLTPLEGEEGRVEYLVFSLNDVTERIRAGEAIRESENQLRILSSQLLTAQENERKRVSRELHDGLQQTLTAIKFKVEAFLLGMNKTRLKEKAKTLEPIVSMIQESVKEIRRIQANLRPPMLDDLGILASLAWLFRDFQGTYPDIRVERAFQVEEKDFPEELKMVIYRILQEALNNIGKHSGAERVSISLRKLENRIELGIRDNGRGFDPQEALSKEQKEKGMGLASMKERVESSEGVFAVRSQKGEGTWIQASWGPLGLEKIDSVI